MKSLWNDQEAGEYPGDLGLRVYTSRLLGREKSLVLHGGGNTSIKIMEKNILGQEEEILYVKGSGWDLETIEADGFSPVRLNYSLDLVKLKSLSDPQMVNELVTHMTRASAPMPSVETILHAILPYKFVDHTHADAVVTITNTGDGEKRIKEIYGDQAIIVPYVMPGFDLARLCAKMFSAQSNEKTIGMILMNHGVFSFGETAKICYERMIALVSSAENYLKKQGAWEILIPAATNVRDKSIKQELAALRKEISKTAERPLILTTNSDAKSVYFARHPNITALSQQGPATPDHVIRTKRLPMLGGNVAAYAEEYKKYFLANAAQARDPKTMLDPAPRVILDPDFGLSAVGSTPKDAAIVSDIYRQTIDIILRAAALGGYQALPAKDIFDVEYWDLEQAKIKKSGNTPALTGELALVTGAASGIGKACAESLLKRGAAVIGLDLNPSINTLFDHKAYFGIRGDITSKPEILSALEAGVNAFGGLDMAILNAGIFPPGRKIEELDSAEWRKVMQINLDANFELMRECYPLLKLSPRGGRVVVIGSKNVHAPGPGVAAYSVSKAALNQLVRVAALEWGKDGIRINSIHPNGVFDTGIWTDEVLTSRAEQYKMSVEEYKRNNVLRVTVTSHDVAELAAEMCGPLFAKTTASQVPVDGGNSRVI